MFHRSAALEIVNPVLALLVGHAYTPTFQSTLLHTLHAVAETGTLLNAALGYAERGWKVHPLFNPEGTGCSCHLPNCASTGKHPRIKWRDEASCDPGTIKHWWHKWPSANIGIVTGAASGIVVIDQDGKHGAENFEAMAEKLGDIPATLTATTGIGRHLFFQHPGLPIRNSAGTLATGVDVRADGAYVVAPPSTHANRNEYSWDNTEEPAPLPPWLLERLLATETPMSPASTRAIERSPVEQGVVINPSDGPVIFEGQRNVELHRAISAMRGQYGMEDHLIVAVLIELNEQATDVPISRAEIEQIAASVRTYPREVAPSKSQDRMDANPLYYFPFNTQKFDANQGDGTWSDRQTGWWIRLLKRTWQGGGFIPADRGELWKLAKADSRKTFDRECGKVLADYVEVDYGNGPLFMHRRMAPEYARTLAKCLKKKIAGKASARARFSQSDDPK